MSESTNPWEALERAVEQGRRYGRRADHFEERALAAEARIEAVRDVLAHHPYGGPEQEDAIRRALDGES